MSAAIPYTSHVQGGSRESVGVEEGGYSESCLLQAWFAGWQRDSTTDNHALTLIFM